MKNLILSMSIILVMILNSYSQTIDSILVKTGRNYTLDQKKLSRSQLKTIYTSYPESLKEYKSGKIYRTSGNILTWGGLAYVVVSSQIVRIDRENDYTDWFNYHSQNGIPGKFDESKYPKQLFINAGIGAGLSLVGLLCLFSAPNHYSKAVNLYNDRHKKLSLSPVQFNLMVRSNGLGIRMSF